MEHNIFMQTGEAPIPRLPNALLAEVERVARAQKRSVSQVLTEAVDRYVKEERWQRLKAYGQERVRTLGLAEDDVPKLIAESRQ